MALDGNEVVLVEFLAKFSLGGEVQVALVELEADFADVATAFGAERLTAGLVGPLEDAGPPVEQNRMLGLVEGLSYGTAPLPPFVYAPNYERLALTSIYDQRVPVPIEARHNCERPEAIPLH